jgi:type I restriction enzyme S subunit
MSSKGKSSAVEGGGASLVPERRFPEFEDAGDWVNVSLGFLVSISTKKVGDKSCVPMSITSGVGLVSQMEKFGRIIAGDSYKNYLQLQKNDFAYNKSATKEYPEGFIALYTGEELAAVPNSIFTCFRIKGEAASSKYLNYLFLGNLHGRWLRKFIEVGARAHGSLSINNSDLLAMPVPVPAGPNALKEEQKIAACLASADALIEAQGRKVEALKAHKKGLMQQLFPQEGETQPRLRFPEFERSGEWRMRAVGDVFKVTRGEVLSMTLVSDTPADEARYPVYSSQTKNFGLAGYYSRFLYQDAITWTTDGANAGDVNFRSGKFFCTNVCGVLISKDGHANACIAALLNSVTRSHVSYVGNPKLMNGVMAGIEIPFPSVPEQQRIADCLTSLDDLIAAEGQKLDTLKTHKKGLMQQLFPQVGEV